MKRPPTKAILVVALYFALSVIPITGQWSPVTLSHAVSYDDWAVSLSDAFTAADGDLIVIVTDPGGGSQAPKKISVSDFLASVDATLAALAGLTITQGSLITGTAADTFAVLAKGSAYQILQMNAGATAPEWSETLNLSALDLSSMIVNAQCTDVATPSACCTGAGTGTCGVFLPVGTQTAPTAEGQIYHNPSTDATTIGNGASADRLLKSSETQRLATFAWDGGGSVVTAGATSKRCTSIPHAGTITGWTLTNQQADTVSIHVYKDAYSADAVATTSITDSHDPATAAKVAATDSDLSDWTAGRTVTANDSICAEVHAAAAATWINLVIWGTR